MPIEPPDDLTDEEGVLFGAYHIAADLAARCRQLLDMAVSVSATALEIVVNALMTEFVDQTFHRRKSDMPSRPL
jgi:hypothetical protein